MAIGSINSVGIYTAVMNNYRKSGIDTRQTPLTASAVKKDTAIISVAARNLAAKMAGSGQEQGTLKPESPIIDSTTHDNL